MKEVAAVIIVVGFLASMITALVGGFTDVEWDTVRSPATGMCYERYTQLGFFGVGVAIAEIDPTYCEVP